MNMISTIYFNVDKAIQKPILCDYDSAKKKFRIPMKLFNANIHLPIIK